MQGVREKTARNIWRHRTQKKGSTVKKQQICPSPSIFYSTHPSRHNAWAGELTNARCSSGLIEIWKVDRNKRRKGARPTGDGWMTRTSTKRTFLKNRELDAKDSDSISEKEVNDDHRTREWTTGRLASTTTSFRRTSIRSQVGPLWIWYIACLWYQQKRVNEWTDRWIWLAR